MFGNLKSTKDYLYHYTSREVGLKHILGDMKLRLGPYSQTNDPKESKNWIFRMSNAPLDKAVFFQEHYINQLQKKTKLLCFTQDSDEYFDLPDKFKFSSRGFSRVRLWTSYAENHEGMCFIFSKKSLIESLNRNFKDLSDLNKIIYNKVQYKELETIMDTFYIDVVKIKEIGLKKTLEEHHKEVAHKIYFHKTPDWQDENEFRIVILNESHEYLYLPIKDSLLGIVLGADFPYNSEEILDKYKERDGIPYSRIGWYNGAAYLRWVRK